MSKSKVAYGIHGTAAYLYDLPFAHTVRVWFDGRVWHVSETDGQGNPVVRS